MDLWEIGLEGVEWIHPAQYRDRWRALVNTVMNLRVLALRSWLVSLHSSVSPSFYKEDSGGLVMLLEFCVRCKGNAARAYKSSTVPS
jgi:hypothetical protein